MVRMYDIENKILLSRLLTRSGDQAWDFALPLTLITVFPSRLDVVATVYLISKLGSVILQPWVAKVVDQVPRLRTAMTGILLQVFGVLFVTIVMVVSRSAFASLGALLSAEVILTLSLIAIGNIVSNLGSGLMDIAVGNDWAPALLDPSRLTKFNSRLRQLDLATEVGAPILGGVILLASTVNLPLLGFFIIGGWNLISFVPEIMLLKGVFKAAPQLQKSLVYQSENAKKGMLSKLFGGWEEFRKQRCMPVMLAYAFLWLSALSPHGVLLTAFLKDGWNMEESTLGLFRGLGAVFGLASTIIFPRMTQRLGLRRSTGAFIICQSVMVLLALLFFVFPFANGLLFLGFILFSRIGLYGFSLGEMEIRQRMIPEGVRGAVNGVATSLTGLSTVLLFALGSYFSTPARFPVLVFISVSAVICGAIVYIDWTRKQNSEELIK